MKMKKIFGGLAMTALIAGAPVTMTSCDEDDINTILDIISLFTSADDLANTAWITSESDYAFEFGSNGQGAYYDGYEGVDAEGNVVAQSFTYSLDTTNNKLTIVLSSGTRVYTVTEFVKGSKLTLTYNGKTIRLIPYTE